MPLGYDTKDRLLIINETVAKVVRTLFNLYRQHRSIRLVKAEANRLGLRTKQRPGAKGELAGGKAFSRGHIHVILSNPIYAGRIRHRDVSYEGAHDAIINLETWAEVQKMLAVGSAKKRGRSGVRDSAPLAGKLFDETGDRLMPSHATKKGRRYRYYVSHRLIASSGVLDASGWRLPAERLERSIADAIAGRLESADFAMRIVDEPSASDVARIFKSLKQVAARIRGEGGQIVLTGLVDKCSVKDGRALIDIEVDAIAKQIDVKNAEINPGTLRIETSFDKRRRGMEARIVLADEAPEIDQSLLRNTAKAMTWLSELKSGGSLDAIAVQEGVSRQRIAVILRLASWPLI